MSDIETNGKSFGTSLSPTLSTLTFIERYGKFIFLVGGIMFFFGCHNYMQELIINLPGFKVGVFLGYLEVLGVAVCSYVERTAMGETTRKASWTSYTMLCFCLLVSSATSNIALAYINYPTKVVFRSCKLIPTMIIAVSFNNKKVAWYEFMFGIFISLGMVLFAAADFQVYPNFDFIGTHSFCFNNYLLSSCIIVSACVGIILVCISVVADAFLPNFQERVFDQGSSRIEVTFFTNILCLTFMSIAFSVTGDIPQAVAYALANPHALYLMTVYTFLAYIAITFHMALVKEFGGIVTVLVGNTRKAVTIVMSFILFPKPMSPLYVWGGLLVFGSLVANAIMKEGYGSGGGGKKGGSNVPSL